MKRLQHHDTFEGVNIMQQLIIYPNGEEVRIQHETDVPGSYKTAKTIDSSIQVEDLELPLYVGVLWRIEGGASGSSMEVYISENAA